MGISSNFRYIPKFQSGWERYSHLYGTPSHGWPKLSPCCCVIFNSRLGPLRRPFGNFRTPRFRLAFSSSLASSQPKGDQDQQEESPGQTIGLRSWRHQRKHPWRPLLRVAPSVDATSSTCQKHPLEPWCLQPKANKNLFKLILVENYATMWKYTYHSNQPNIECRVKVWWFSEWVTSPEVYQKD